VLQVWFTQDAVNVQDLRDPRAAPLVFTHAEWSAFVEGIRRGEFQFTNSLHDDDAPSLDEHEP